MGQFNYTFWIQLLVYLFASGCQGAVQADVCKNCSNLNDKEYPLSATLGICCTETQNELKCELHANKALSFGLFFSS